MKLSFIATIILSIAGLAGSASAIELEVPVQCRLGDNCFIQNYVDQGKGEQHQDFRCRKLSYDKHKGTDFRMPVMNTSGANIAVLAAADGVVKGVRNGEVDMHLKRLEKPSVKDKECGNGLVLEHADGWETQYCHLRNNTIRVKEGQSVKAGDVLGEIGLSGETEFPHLHLSVRNPEGEHIDPFNAQPMESGCAVTQTQLWSEKARPALNITETGLLASGVENRPVDVRDVIEGKHIATSLPSTSPALVFWTLSYGLHEGDEITMMLFYPDGTPLAEDTSKIDGFKAQYLQFIGKRNRDGKALPVGKYEGIISVKRGTTVLINKTIGFEITP